jgi:hypothetical protein
MVAHGHPSAKKNDVFLGPAAIIQHVSRLQFLLAFSAHVGTPPEIKREEHCAAIETGA